MDALKRDQLFPSAKVFCNPHLLAALQTSPFRHFRDSKTFVDLQLKLSPDRVLHLFSLLPSTPSQKEYDSFMEAAFEKEGTTSLVRKVMPPDYTALLPPCVAKLQNPNKSLVDFVSDLKRRWSVLCRENVSIPNQTADVDIEVLFKCSSLIPLPHPFFIPGGRFQECYYWDTFWIVKGLVASQMLISAQNAVRNLIHMVHRVGFVPNGNRVYFLNRSQPPVLTLCVAAVYDAIENKEDQLSWLRETLPALDKEYDWFAQHRSVSNSGTCIPSNDSVALSGYNVENHLPRPESFSEDRSTLALLQKKLRLRVLTAQDAKNLYKNLASCCESGWDFSSRWFSEGGGLESVRICEIIPCCLNGILLKVERQLANFHKVLSSEDATAVAPQAIEISPIEICERLTDHIEASQKYERLAEQRQHSIQKVLWSEEKGFWLDYNASEGVHAETVSSAGLYLLWADCWDPNWGMKEAKQFVDFLVCSSGLLHPGGLASTARVSEEQWDFPNCWPPLVDIAVEGLSRLGKRFPGSGAEKAAETIAMRFLESAYRGWLAEGTMHEKYNCKASTGERGEGGEYLPQTGFGWTNGTILWLLQRYAHLFNSFLSTSFGHDGT